MVGSKNMKGILIVVLLGLGCLQAQGQRMHKDLYVLTGGSRSLIDDYYMTSLDVGVNFSEYSWGSMGPELNVYRFWDNSYNSIGIGLRLATQIFLLRHRNADIFTEIRGGPIYMLPEKTDNNLNFTFICGFGSDINLTKNSAVRFCADYSHFSNGKRNGAAHNPTWDGISCYLGWVYRFTKWK